MSADGAFSVRPQDTPVVVAARPKGAYGTADEAFLVCTFACLPLRLASYAFWTGDAAFPSRSSMHECRGPVPLHGASPRCMMLHQRPTRYTRMTSLGCSPRPAPPPPPLSTPRLDSWGWIPCCGVEASVAPPVNGPEKGPDPHGGLTGTRHVSCSFLLRSPTRSTAAPPPPPLSHRCPVGCCLPPGALSDTAVRPIP